MIDEKYRRFASDITDFMFIGDDPCPSDVIFVPGNDKPQMAEKAAELYRDGFAKYVLPSGRWYIGLGYFPGPATCGSLYSGPYKTEWEFLRDVLVKNGVPEEAILREDRATFTYENAINCRAVTDKAGIDVRRAILVTNTIHARRSRMYFRLLYPDTEFISCPVAATGITRDNWLDKPERVEAVISEFERCGGQFMDILKEMAGEDESI